MDNIEKKVKQMSLNQIPISFITKCLGKSHVESIIKRYIKSRPDYVSDEILKAVLEVFDIDIETIRLKKRKGSPLVARQMFCYLSFENTNKSNEEIGDIVGLDHATVVHSRKTCLERCTNDPKYRFHGMTFKQTLELIQSNINQSKSV